MMLQGYCPCPQWVMNRHENLPFSRETQIMQWWNHLLMIMYKRGHQKLPTKKWPYSTKKDFIGVKNIASPDPIPASMSHLYRPQSGEGGQTFQIFHRNLREQLRIRDLVKSSAVLICRRKSKHHRQIFRLVSIFNVTRAADSISNTFLRIERQEQVHQKPVFHIRSTTRGPWQKTDKAC